MTEPVVLAVDGNSLNDVLAKAKAQGIYVIAYDRLIMNTPDVDCYVTFDNAKVGEAEAAYIIKHLGLEVIRDGGEDNCFLGAGGDFFLTLFRGDRPGLNHYCYAIKDYDAARAEEKLKAAGLKPRREGNRVYFHDPDGIEVQVAGS